MKTKSIAATEGTAVHRAADRALPRLEGVVHRFVDLPRLRMHVAQAGSRDPVLLLHGFPQHWWQWRKVIPRLAQHHHVICPDMRGAGWAEAPPAGYTRQQLLADVVALLDVLNLDRVHVIAHDAGVPIGFELCLNHPCRVRNYLALSVPHPYVNFSRRMLTVLWDGLWLEPVIATPLLGPGLMGQWPCFKVLGGIVTVSWRMMVLKGSLRTAGCRTGSRSVS